MRLSKLMKAVIGQIPDLIMLIGAGSVAYGAWMIHQPSGFIVGGFLAMLAGYIIARGAG